MKRILFFALSSLVLSFICCQTLMAFDLPSGYDDIDDNQSITEIDDPVTQKYELKIVSITATYNNGSSSEIYSNTDGSDAVDLAATTAGTNGSEFLSITDVTAGTITSLQIVFSSSIKVKGYQTYVADPGGNQQMYTTENDQNTYYGYYAAYVANHLTTNSEDATIDVSSDTYGGTTEQLTVTINNLNIEITSGSSKSAKLVFDLSGGLNFGFNSSEWKCAVTPGSPSDMIDTTNSGEI